MTALPFKTCYRNNRSTGKLERLFLFVFTDTRYTRNNRYNEVAEQEEIFPRYVHTHHLPLPRKAKEIILHFLDRIRKRRHRNGAL